MKSERDVFANTYDLSVLRSSANKISKGVEEGLNGSLREEIEALDALFSREEFKEWIDSLDEDLFQRLRRTVHREDRRMTLRNRSSKLSYIHNVDIDSGLKKDEKIEKLVQQLSSRETAYYDAHFEFASTSSYLYTIDGFEGVVGGIATDAAGPHDAEEKFAERARERDDIDETYASAAEGLAPIAGKLEKAPKPRVIKFEDEDHIFIEFWAVGTEDSIFDGQEGYSMNYNPRIRSAARMHLDTGMVEVFDGKKKEQHRKTLVDRLEKLCNGAKLVTDGGEQKTREINILREKTLSEDNIWDVMDSIGMLTTLEGFGGRTADAKLSAVHNRDVRKDDTHEDLRHDRNLELANIKLFFDDLEGIREFVKPSEIGEKIEFEKEATQSEMKEEIGKMFDYKNIDHVTLTLNEDNNTFRVQKKNCSPATRQAVFHLVSEELGW
ncbi:hypothetical protein [Natrinema sp. DC36]|uniref:hypothetical protein n=1 Tax=Natrinema sp. DC36 TaxID=2878680 RepID=UPI001CF0CC13|nr:hypothetical protein [Natrinema sp. DC36]